MTSSNSAMATRSLSVSSAMATDSADNAQNDNSAGAEQTPLPAPQDAAAARDGSDEAQAQGVCMAAGVEGWDRRLQIGGVFIILGVSALGAMLPVACKHVAWLNVNARLLTLGKFFGAGVILATAFVHMLGGATEALKDDCVDGRMGDFDSWPGFLAMVAVLAMHLMEHVLTARYIGSDSELAHTLSRHANTLADASPGAHTPQLLGDEERKAGEPKQRAAGHMHGALFADERRRQLSTYILELGIALHSVIVGMTLAVTGGAEYKTLLAAISFHQFFEGMALGTRIAELNFKRRPLVLGLLNALVFALTTPLGQTIGIAVRQSFAPRSPTTLVTMGVLDSLSAGILMYSAIVNLLVEEFAAPEFRVSSRNARIACFAAMYAGCAGMSIIGKWA
ncbi:hypothetical protein GGI02_004731 [Coemansia sp. RSA 2322]|uniref:Uncharacterized protein n=1 Tax=Coemansia thaxteri TaxID=2663907 RepID=A0A9W8BLX8_9FUNG|nr:hypothetical protein H4R26_001941 [Coemansia thaxteri]KAJ2465329.1 hypothetical protein GGI02_004731 [Coemansia sp. RSA 2322]KAJ2483833.1 hypothetical protein EV174_002842 [Coemansia sp. RSA 2320]